MTMLRPCKVMGAVAVVSLVSACSPDPEDRVGFWRPDDRQISLHAFGYFGGSFDWVGRREMLTGEQLEALSGLKLIPSADGCWTDITEYSLVVVDAAGQEREAMAREDNSSCGSGRDVIDIETLRPLLATLECGATGSASTELSKAKTVRADNGCQHAFFSYQDEPAKWLKVVASRPGPHSFQVSQCGGKTTGLALFDESGTVLLASGRAEGTSNSDCATLTHPLEAGRVYALEVTSRAMTTGGHVYLEIRGN